MIHDRSTLGAGWRSGGLIVAGLLVLLLSVACGAPSAPAPDTAAGPAIQLDPSSGQLNAQVALRGSGFALNTRVRVGLTVANPASEPQPEPQREPQREPQFIGEVLTDGAGSFRLIFVVPATWPDGAPIVDRELTFTASTADGSASARATYTNSAAGAASASKPVATLALATATRRPRLPAAEPVIRLDPASGGPHSSVSIYGGGFGPQAALIVRIGLPGVGAGPQSFGSGTSDANGNVAITFAMPDQWADGSPIAARELMVILGTTDGAQRALAEFSYDPNAIVVVVATVTPSVTHSPVVEAGAAGTAAGTDTPEPTVAVTTPEPTAESEASATPELAATSAPSDTPEPATPQATATQEPSATPQLTDTPAATEVVAAPASPDPIQATIDFLNTYLRDNTGAHTVGYLSQRLQASLAARSIEEALGFAPSYSTFEIAGVARSDTSATVQATLSYASGPRVYNINLENEGGDWRVDSAVEQ